jgi:hypothetical protein
MKVTTLVFRGFLDLVTAVCFLEQNIAAYASCVSLSISEACLC